MDNREEEIIEFIRSNKEVSSKEIHEAVSNSISYATVKRILAKLVDENLLQTKGKGKSTKYSISAAYKLLHPVNLEKYYEKEIDEREISGQFNFDVITEVLAQNNVFTAAELKKLDLLQQEYAKNISQLSNTEYKKELDRLAIDLSWKSSQIEGNTYSLLETELLLKEKETAAGKTKEEAIMLLNHKDAIDFIIEHPDYLLPLTKSKIEDIHSILVKDLGIDKNLRTGALALPEQITNRWIMNSRFPKP